MSRVVILSSQSIFAEGVAARLKQHLDGQSLLIVDTREPDALQRVIAAHPTAVILDVSDSETERSCSLGTLLDALPALTLIRLDPSQDQVQVVTSEQRAVHQVQDIVQVIKAT